MLKIRRLLLSFVLLIFNIINFSVLLSNIDDDYTNIFITLFYFFLIYFVCVWLSSTFGIAWFGWFGLHIGLTILLIILFEMK